MANDKVIRKNIESIQGEELTQLQEGYRRMQAIYDNRGFNYIAGFHGVPNNYCPHNTKLFLPWHRAYMYYFEQYLQDRIEGLAVPWWDWSRSNSLPPAFNAPRTANGQPNPLNKFRIKRPLAKPPVDRDTVRFAGTSPRLNLPTAAQVASILDIRDFNQFSDAISAIHGQVHMWTGGSGRDPVTGRPISGDMAQVDFAAYDPIFFSHHCMIDRLWYMWQLRRGINNIPNSLLNQVLQPFNMRVADVLDISKLGYDYAVDQITVASSAGNR